MNMREEIQKIFPQPQGLYHPENEHDACGVGFICNLHGKKSHDIIHHALEILVRLTHRGASGADPLTGDGAGIAAGGGAPPLDVRGRQIGLGGFP